MVSVHIHAPGSLTRPLFSLETVSWFAAQPGWLPSYMTIRIFHFVLVSLWILGFCPL